MRVTVIGGGIMGLSTAWALDRQGHQVCLLEQGPLPNPAGSSCDQHRAIRHAYGTETGYARLVADAFPAWERMARDLGRRIYHRTGLIAFDRPGGTWARDSAAVLHRLGLPHRLLDPAEAARRYPLLDLSETEAALETEEGGVLAAREILSALAEHLRARGVELRQQTQVHAVDPDRARADTDAGPVDADALVIAAGPWARRLLGAEHAPAAPSRQLVVYMTPPGEQAAAWAGMPTVVDIDAHGGTYVIPPVAGLGMKLGDHTLSMAGDPDDPRIAGAEEIERLATAAGRRVRDWARYAVAEAKVCFYTVSADERFVVRPLAERTWLATGFSGHGFKFGALVGETLADAVTGRVSPEAARALMAGEVPLDADA
jgi:glycine/D-amino acid oxidase-like deaminating enzyme